MASRVQLPSASELKKSRAEVLFRDRQQGLLPALDHTSIFLRTNFSDQADDIAELAYNIIWRCVLLFYHSIQEVSHRPDKNSFGSSRSPRLDIDKRISN